MARPSQSGTDATEAVQAVERGEAEIVMVAYFDRLVRSVRVQEEVVSRVEAAGGRVLALDVGQITGASAAKWLSSTMLGAVSEYQRRSVGERSAEAQEDAVDRGVPPWSTVPLGYRKREDARLEPDPSTAATIQEAWARRVQGAPIREIREWLRKGGVDASYDRVQRMFHMRVYLGEINFGKLHNPTAHEPLIDRGTWEAVQRGYVRRGPLSRSDRLLARLGVLRCGGCDGRMVVSKGGDGYEVYRCPNVTSGDCDLRVTIQVEIAEETVVKRVREAIADIRGHASVDEEAREAAEDAGRAQADLEAGIRVFAGVADEPVALERLTELRAKRDAAADRSRHLSSRLSAVTLSGADWDRLSLTAKREIIQAVVASAVVGRGVPGHRTDRIRVELL